eukprot:IDg22533t1
MAEIFHSEISRLRRDLHVSAIFSPHTVSPARCEQCTPAATAPCVSLTCQKPDCGLKAVQARRLTKKIEEFCSARAVAAVPRLHPVSTEDAVMPVASDLPVPDTGTSPHAQNYDTREASDSDPDFDVDAAAEEAALVEADDNLSGPSKPSRRAARICRGPEQGVAGRPVISLREVPGKTCKCSSRLDLVIPQLSGAIRTNSERVARARESRQKIESKLGLGHNWLASVHRKAVSLSQIPTMSMRKQDIGTRDVLNRLVLPEGNTLTAR